MLFWLVLVFILVIKTDDILWTLKILVLATLLSLFLSLSLSLSLSLWTVTILLHFVNCPQLLFILWHSLGCISAHFLKRILPYTHCILLSKDQASFWAMCCIKVLALPLGNGPVSLWIAHIFASLFDMFHHVKSYAFFLMWQYCFALSLHSFFCPCKDPLVTSLVFLNDVHSFIQLTVIISSLMLFINAFSTPLIAWVMPYFRTCLFSSFCISYVFSLKLPCWDCLAWVYFVGAAYTS